MINFKGLFNDNSSAIGLTSLGLAKKIEDKGTPAKSVATIRSANQLKQNMSIFSAQNSSVQLDFSKSNDEVLENLFNNKNVLNFNNSSLLG